MTSTPATRSGPAAPYAPSPLLLWGPAAAYMALVFGMSAMPGALSLPLWLSDKTAHALEYAGLAVVTMRALARGAWAGVRIATAISTLLIAVAHGVSGETFQQFVPGRQSDFGDLVADAVGAGAAVVAICAWGIIRRFSGARAGQE